MCKTSLVSLLHGRANILASKEAKSAPLPHPTPPPPLQLLPKPLWINDQLLVVHTLTHIWRFESIFFYFFCEKDKTQKVLN